MSNTINPFEQWLQNQSKKIKSMPKEEQLKEYRLFLDKLMKKTADWFGGAR